MKNDLSKDKQIFFKEGKTEISAALPKEIIKKGLTESPQAVQKPNPPKENKNK